MNIGIDARMYGLEHAGIGRYVQNLISQLIDLYPQDHFTLFLRSQYFKPLKLPTNTTKVKADFRHYTTQEQFEFPRLINRYPIDLMHFPHFNVPLFYQRPFIVTIHDLLWHEYKGLKVTSLSPLKYALKYGFYHLVVRHAVFKSQAIITPSRWVKNQIKRHYPAVNSQKIHPTYEGVDTSLSHVKASSFIPLKKKYHLDCPYLVYTGSAYPHKNLDKLIAAVKAINHTETEPLKLVIVSSRNIFLDQLKKYTQKISASQFVVFTGFLPDHQLKSLYQHAALLVHPSASEGFGLTGLEAMACGLPVVASKAGSLPETYGKAAVFIDPEDQRDMIDKITIALEDPSLRRHLISAGKIQAKKYSWTKTAQQTHSIYQQVINS